MWPKLYKNSDGVMLYWEAWEDNNRTGIVHWGIIGNEGQSEKITSGLLTGFQKKIQKLFDKKVSEGYREAEQELTLLIEYAVDDMGTKEDVEKRYRLQDRMDQVLGWTGLGNCDGGSIGSGTMEVCCIVVDFDVAKSIITKYLAGTEFANYTRIYNEEEEL